MHAHLDAGCDAVLVCHPSLVEESLAAMEGHELDATRLAALAGRDGGSWAALLTDGRYSARRPRSNRCRCSPAMPARLPNDEGERDMSAQLADALANSHVVHDRATLEAAIERIAGDIAAEYAGDGSAAPCS